MAHEIISKRLDELAALVDQADTIKATFAERRAKLIKPMPAALKNKLSAIDGEEAEALKDLSQQIASADSEIRQAVVVAGETVKGARMMGVYAKGRITWNSDMLEGMIIALPEIDIKRARSEGEPSCTIRKR